MPEEIEVLEDKLSKALEKIEGAVQINLGQLKSRAAMLFREIKLAMIFTEQFDELPNYNKEKVQEKIYKAIQKKS